MTMDQEDPQSDIFSLSDHLLAERLHFIKEIGFGNWGSVWLCRPKHSSSESDHHVAVKLVHRSKTSTTAARVRSLWNEMKIVRSFKHDPHPSIIPFHSFIITPSYALITMAYLPALIPVEVAEPKAKDWFNSLLSGVHFLHERGVVHNDIKPANILLSPQSVPVLVDFGFAEKYDLSSPKAFHSNLAYGTPEYLSPERARGLPHDTRKSDIWSLGVTFFEILVGRTPFEYEEGEQFSTKEDLEKYWTRTMRGKWVGTIKVKFSKSIEKLLKHMISPNADLRWTASEVLADVYWTMSIEKQGHKKSASVAHAVSPGVVLDRDMSRLLDVSMPWRTASGGSSTKDKDKTKAKDKDRIGTSSSKSKAVESVASSSVRDNHRDEENPNQVKPDEAEVKVYNNNCDISRKATNTQTTKGNDKATNRKQIKNDKENNALLSSQVNANICAHSRSKSVPKLATGKPVPPKKRVHANVLGPIRGSPAAKENTSITTSSSIRTANPDVSQTSTIFSLNSLTRKPLGPRQPSVRALKNKENGPAVKNVNGPKTGAAANLKHANEERKTRGRGALADLTASSRNASSNGTQDVDTRVGKDQGFIKDGAKDKENIQTTPAHADTKTAGNVTLLSDWSATTTSISGSERRGKDSVRDRMREWERERERLREMERMTELEREREGDHENEHQSEQGESSFEVEAEGEAVQKVEVTRARIGVRASAQVQVVSPSPCGSINFTKSAELLSGLVDIPAEASPRAGEFGLTGLKQNIKVSLDKGVRMYKSSALGQLTGRTTPGATLDVPDGEGEGRFSWEEVRAEDEPKSAKDNQQALDRMTMWQRNVENIVEDARLNFASRSTSVTPPPALPLSPVNISRSSSQCKPNAKVSLGNSGNTSYSYGGNTSRSSRFPRKVLAANQIFVDNCEQDESHYDQEQSYYAKPEQLSTGGDADRSASFSAYLATSEKSGANASELGFVYARMGVDRASTLPGIPSEELSHAPSLVPTIPTINVIMQTPPRLQRRATILSRSPQTEDRHRESMTLGTKRDDDDDLDLNSSPSRRRGKSKSSGNLFGRIQPISTLEYELSREPIPAPSPRLSSVLHRNLFVASPVSPSFTDDIPSTPVTTSRDQSILQFDDLTSSPYHVEPYPQRKPLIEIPVLDTPNKQRVEGVYDRFLMAATGVKRVGRGYQSDNRRSIQHVATRAPEPKLAGPHANRNFRVFSSARRAMPPPVSSEDVWRSSSVDEFGYVATTPELRAEREIREINKENTVTLMRRAIKAMVPGKTVSRRLSRTLVAA